MKGRKAKPKVSRRDFLKYCGIGAGALGLSMTDLGLLEKEATYWLWKGDPHGL